MSTMLNTYAVVRWTASGKWHRLDDVSGWTETTGCGRTVGDRASYGQVEVNPWDVPNYLCPRCGFDY